MEPSGKLTALEAALASQRWGVAKKILERGAGSLNLAGSRGQILWGMALEPGDEKDMEAAAGKKPFFVASKARLWEWALRRGLVDLSARRADGKLELDEALRNPEFLGMGWKALEERAQARGLERSPDDWARLAGAAARAASRRAASIHETMGEGFAKAVEGERSIKVPQAWAALLGKARGCSPEAAEGMLADAALAFLESKRNSIGNKLSLILLEGALEAFPQASVLVEASRFAGPGDEPARAMLERRALNAQAPAAERGGPRRGL